MKNKTDNLEEYFVDLGLPSGLKWAKTNLGAETETDYGDYFMWGSTTPNTTSVGAWAICPFNNHNTDYDEEYFKSVKDTVCPNGVLAKEYDAAAQIMGGDWRMPTKTEFRELIDNTDSEWVKDFNGSGVNGGKFTSKVNGNSIFIPASGYRSVSSFYGQGNYGYVWSSSLYAVGPDYAWDLYFSSVYVHSDNYYRRGGFAVRGVMN